MFTYGIVHLVVTSNVFMQSSQHDHGYHTREEENYYQRIHDAVGIYWQGEITKLQYIRYRIISKKNTQSLLNSN